MIVGAICHHMGKPMKTVSYSAIFASVSASAGREDLSFISTELRELSSRQFRSSFVYASWGLISYKSAPAVSARTSANLRVTPLAEKYATNLLLIVFPPYFVRLKGFVLFNLFGFNSPQL